MKRIFFLFLLTLLSYNSLFAANKPDWKITPFTGTDYIRIVVDADFRLDTKSKFKVVIKSAADGKSLWQGDVVPEAAINEGRSRLAFTVHNLKPVLWMPANPYLYNVSLQQYRDGKLQSELKERAGFRSFERRKGNLYLNGRPIFLRGIAINPPGRGIPEALENSREFALDYVRFMKSINVNIIRIPDAEEWFDVCDELGMMVFGGNYSGKVGSGDKVQKAEAVGDETDGGFPANYDSGVSWYENDKLGPIAHHPSLMVYAMTNETPFAGQRAVQWEKFLNYSYNKLKAWDETRVYIANAGYGYGKAGDICDIHRYWGWYYNSPYTFLNIRNNATIPFPKKDQPITFTECVGNYTGPDGRYNLTPSHKNPASQLAWTGHEREDLQAHLADEHQIHTLRQATESFRQFRDINPDLSGVFPFTILFYNWDTIEKFADMKPKPVTGQVKISYQPVLLSWECWTPNVYAGSTIKPIAHIINDDDNFQDLKNASLIVELRDKTQRMVYRDSMKLADVPYFGTDKKQLQIKLPADISTGNYQLNGKIVRENKTVSQNYYKLFIADPFFTPSVAYDTPVLLYDKLGVTKKAFAKLNLKFKELNSFNKLLAGEVVVIGENSADQQLADNAALIKSYLQSGGRILSLRQDSLHMSILNAVTTSPLGNTNTDIDGAAYPMTTKSPRNGYYVNPERPEHPIFAGISRENLKLWSDYSSFNVSKPGFPALRPVTDGFTLTNSDDVGNTAILADFASGLRSIALAEQYSGTGSIILCGLDLANRAGLDPVASRLLINLVNYSGSQTGHERYALITNPIIWGEYETEKGIITDIYSGFLVNASPRLPATFTRGIAVTKDGYQLAGGSASGFNTRPGIQYVANGRRPFGPFTQSFGGQPQIINKSSAIGTGKFWCRIPEGQNNMTSVVWNPAKEALQISIKVNGLLETLQTIKPGERIAVDCPVDKADLNVTYSGDRRLVILETAFSKKNLK